MTDLDRGRGGASSTDADDDAIVGIIFDIGGSCAAQRDCGGGGGSWAVGFGGG